MEATGGTYQNLMDNDFKEISGRCLDTFAIVVTSHAEFVYGLITSVFERKKPLDRSSRLNANVNENVLRQAILSDMEEDDDEAALGGFIENCGHHLQIQVEQTIQRREIEPFVRLTQIPNHSHLS